MTPCLPGCCIVNRFSTRPSDKQNLGTVHYVHAVPLVSEGGWVEGNSRRARQWWRTCISAVHAGSFLNVETAVAAVIKVHHYTNLRYVTGCSCMYCWGADTLQMWNGLFWEDTTLEKLGVVFQLSHAGGDCPVPKLPWWLTVLHVNGIHRVHVAFCSCNVSAAENHWRQIMRNGWYPATLVDPHSCATFDCLDTFHLLNVMVNVNVRDYVTFLEQSTDAYGT